jgi:hypothetical protein
MLLLPRLRKIVNHLPTFAERIAVDPTNAVGVIVNAAPASNHGMIPEKNKLLLAGCLVYQFVHTSNSIQHVYELPEQYTSQR